MRKEGQNGGIPLAVMLAALALLPVLATLQYRWIGQVSRAERENLEADLHLSVDRFTDDFNRTIRRALAALERRSREPEAESTAEIAWNNPPDLRVFRGFYVSEDDQLLQWNNATGQLEPAAWPAAFASLRARLSGPHRRRPLIGMFFEESIPAVVAPLRPVYAPGRRPGFGGPAAWAIAEVDLEYLRTQVVPALVQKDFPASNGLDYQVEIVGVANPHEIVFRSAGDFPPNFVSAAEETRNLFETRPAGPRRAFVPPPLREPVDAQGWLLAVRPRQGSLAAVVSQTRARNLAVSFAILLLLGAGMATLAVSARRAHRLARLQMRFVAGVSHELRTPLAVICSAGENLADGVVSGAEQVRRYGATVRDEGRRLSEMVEQTLGFAGIQAGRMRFESQPVDIAAMIEQAVSSYRSDLADSACSLEMHVPPDLPPVMGDARYLAQCLRNLLSNALKYAPESGWVGVRAAAAESEQSPEVQVIVEDHGPGIERADLPHIFEPFYRGHNAVSAQIQGAGLGLSLVKNIVEAHGGKVDVDSHPGKGSRFTLHLPALAKGVAHPA